MVFVGDTMFAMGCGRLFEGTAEQMYRNLRRIAALPGDVRIYCGHEYTLANARFAAHAEPGNAAIADRLVAVSALRDAGKITLPTTVAEELATNPFVRATDAAGVRAAEARQRQLPFMNQSAVEERGGAQKETSRRSKCV